MAKKSNKFTEEVFLSLCQQVEDSSSFNPNETEEERIKFIERCKKDYAFFFKEMFPKFAKAETAGFHIKLAKAIKKDKSFRGIWAAFRGAAKSIHGGMGIPMWLMINDELSCMLMIGQTENKAHRLIGTLQAQLMKNKKFIHYFGEQYSYGNWSEGEFVTKQGVAFFALGMGQSPNGTRMDEKRPDFILCDDLHYKKLEKNPAMVKEFCEWIEEDLMGCFDGTPDRFLLVNNITSKNSIIYALIQKMVEQRTAGEKWWYMQTNALDKNGQPTWPEKYTKEHWEAKKKLSTYKAFERTYQNNPIEEGKDFKEEWIHYKDLQPLKEYDCIVVYGDPSWKEDANSDFKAVKTWGSYKTQLHMIDAWVRQTTPLDMVRYYYDHYEEYVIKRKLNIEYFIEANMLQFMWEDWFYEEGERRGYQLPINYDKDKKDDKYGRIVSMSPNYQNGYVYWNLKKKNDPDFIESKNQLIMIEPGYKTPDDSPDADHGAWTKILKRVKSNTRKPPLIGYSELNQDNW